MIQDLTVYVDFLVENDITSEQYLLLHSLYIDRLDTKENGRWYIQQRGKGHPIANLYKYHEKRKWLPDELMDLVRKGFVLNRNKSGEFYPDNFVVTDKFINAVFANRREFYEFLESYPDFTESFNANDPRMVPLKMVGEEEIYAAYVKYVGTKPEHSRMMRALEWGVETGQITIKITNFLQSRYWKSLEKLMDTYDQDTEARGNLA